MFSRMGRNNTETASFPKHPSNLISFHLKRTPAPFPRALPVPYILHVSMTTREQTGSEGAHTAAKQQYSLCESTALRSAAALRQNRALPTPDGCLPLLSHPHPRPATLTRRFPPSENPRPEVPSSRRARIAPQTLSPRPALQVGALGRAFHSPAQPPSRPSPFSAMAPARPQRAPKAKVARDGSPASRRQGGSQSGAAAAPLVPLSRTHARTSHPAAPDGEGGSCAAARGWGCADRKGGMGRSGFRCETVSAGCVNGGAAGAAEVTETLSPFL